MWFPVCALSFAVGVALHAVVTRLFPRADRVQQFAACALVAGGLLAVGFRALGGLHRLDWLAGYAAFGFACELYLFLISLVVSSVAVSLLFQATMTPSDPGPEETAAPAGGMVQRRLLRMTAAGLLARQGDVFHLTRKGRVMVWGFRTLRRVFRHEAAPEFLSE